MKRKRVNRGGAKVAKGRGEEGSGGQGAVALKVVSKSVAADMI